MLRLLTRRACRASGASAVPTAVGVASAAASVPAAVVVRGLAGRGFQHTPGSTPPPPKRRGPPPSSVPRPADPKPAAPAAAAAAPAAAKASQAQASAPSQSAGRPSPPPPSSSSAGAGQPDWDSMLNDPRVSAMLSNPLLRKSLESPAARAQMEALLADPSKLDSALSNPMLKRAVGFMSHDMKQSFEQLQNPDTRKQFVEQITQPGRMNGLLDAVEKKRMQNDAATPAAAAADAAPAPKPAAPAAPAAAPKAATPVAAAAAATPTPSTAASSTTSSSSTPPPPPPSNGQGAAAAAASSPEDSLTPTQRRLFRWSDLLLGGVAGFLVWQLAAFLLDRPEVLDAVVSAAEEDALIQAKVGSPAKAGLLWSGNVNPTHASLVVPISGPKGSATVHARAFYDKHFKSWKLMLLQASVDGEAQKHTLLIPDRFVIKPRYVSPEEAERIRKKYEDMQAKMAEHHARRTPVVDPAAAVTQAQAATPVDKASK